MRIAVLADLHGHTGHLRAALSCIADAGLLILPGDLIGFGRPEKASRDEVARILDPFLKLQIPVLAVRGNCDLPVVTEYLTDTGIGLDNRTTELDGITFLGLGGSLPCPESTPYEFSEAQLESHLDRAVASWARATPLVLVSHQPPHDTDADLAFNGKHVGSTAVRAFIEKQQPLLCITGHIHEGRGIDHIGPTVVVNPGTFREGRFATCEILGAAVRAELHSAFGRTPGLA